MDFKLRCIACGAEYLPQEIRYNCDCGGLLDVEHDLDSLREQVSRELFDNRLGDLALPYASGVWRYRELILPLDERAIVSRPEGNTNLYRPSTALRRTPGPLALVLDPLSPVSLGHRTKGLGTVLDRPGSLGPRTKGPVQCQRTRGPLSLGT